MPVRVRFLPLLALLLPLSIIACGGDDDDGGSGASATNGREPTATGGSGGGGGDGGSGGGDGGGFGSGTGTLTIGDETWEVTGIGCVFSAEEARNPDFPFNLSGFTQSSAGARAQVSADIYDPSGEERHEGDGVSHNITIDDVEDFENPSVSWESLGGLASGGEPAVLTINGKSITGQGLFDDGTTDELEKVPGTLEVRCP